jgi:hypothetical protein
MKQYSVRPSQGVIDFIEESIKKSRRSANAELSLLLEFAVKEKLRNRKKIRDEEKV